MTTAKQNPEQPRRRKAVAAICAATFLPGTDILAANLPQAERIRFDFHQALGVNLHHFLYNAARNDPQLTRTSWHLQPNTQQRQALLQAISYYQAGLSQRDVLFDDTMYAIKLALTKAPDLIDDTYPFAVEASLQRTLQLALPAYRECVWPADLAKNRLWQRCVEALNLSHGAELWQRLQYQLAPCPLSQAIRVDLVTLTGTFQGAYTDHVSEQIVLPSARGDYQGLSSLEMLYHEACHIGMMRPIMDELTRAFERAGKPVNQQLWHAIQFYTVGKACQTTYGKHGLDYRPYHEVKRLFELAPGWQRYRQPISSHWQAWLDGKINQDEALQLMVRDLPPDTSPEKG